MKSLPARPLRPLLAAALFVSCATSPATAPPKPFLVQALETQQGFCTGAPKTLGYIPKECALRDSSGNVTSYNDDFYTQINCTYHNSDGAITYRYIPYDYNRKPAPGNFLSWNKGDSIPRDLYCDTSVLR
jgi:hypothetical protein